MANGSLKNLIVVSLLLTYVSSSTATEDGRSEQTAVEAGHPNPDKRLDSSNVGATVENNPMRRSVDDTAEYSSERRTSDDVTAEYSLQRRSSDDVMVQSSPQRLSSDDVTGRLDRLPVARRGGQAARSTVWRESGTPGVLVPKDKSSGPARPKLPGNLRLPALRIPLSVGFPPRPIGRGRRQTPARRRPPRQQPVQPRGRRRGPWRPQNTQRGTRGAPGPPAAARGGVRRHHQPRRSPLPGEDIPPLPPPPPPTPSGQLAPPEPPSLPGPDQFPPLAPEFRQGGRREQDDRQTETGDLNRQEDKKIVILYGSNLKEVDEVTFDGASDQKAAAQTIAAGPYPESSGTGSGGYQPGGGYARVPGQGGGGYDIVRGNAGYQENVGPGGGYTIGNSRGYQGSVTDVYGPQARGISREYGPPRGGVSQEYGPPRGGTSAEYGPPKGGISQEYGPPQGGISSEYGPPQGSNIGGYGQLGGVSQEYGPPGGGVIGGYGPPGGSSGNYGPPGGGPFLSGGGGYQGAVGSAGFGGFQPGYRPVPGQYPFSNRPLYYGETYLIHNPDANAKKRSSAPLLPGEGNEIGPAVNLREYFRRYIEGTTGGALGVKRRPEREQGGFHGNAVEHLPQGGGVEIDDDVEYVALTGHGHESYKVGPLSEQEQPFTDDFDDTVSGSAGSGSYGSGHAGAGSLGSGAVGSGIGGVGQGAIHLAGAGPSSAGQLGYGLVGSGSSGAQIGSGNINIGGSSPAVFGRNEAYKVKNKLDHYLNSPKPNNPTSYIHFVLGSLPKEPLPLSSEPFSPGLSSGGVALSIEESQTISESNYGSPQGDEGYATPEDGGVPYEFNKFQYAGAIVNDKETAYVYEDLHEPENKIVIPCATCSGGTPGAGPSLAIGEGDAIEVDGGYVAEPYQKSEEIYPDVPGLISGPGPETLPSSELTPAQSLIPPHEKVSPVVTLQPPAITPLYPPLAPFEQQERRFVASKAIHEDSGHRSGRQYSDARDGGSFRPSAIMYGGFVPITGSDKLKGEVREARRALPSSIKEIVYSEPIAKAGERVDEALSDWQPVVRRTKHRRSEDTDTSQTAGSAVEATPVPEHQTDTLLAKSISGDRRSRKRTHSTSGHNRERRAALQAVQGHPAFVVRDSEVPARPPVVSLFTQDEQYRVLADVHKTMKRSLEIMHLSNSTAPYGAPLPTARMGVSESRTPSFTASVSRTLQTVESPLQKVESPQQKATPPQSAALRDVAVLLLSKADEEEEVEKMSASEKLVGSLLIPKKKRKVTPTDTVEGASGLLIPKGGGKVVPMDTSMKITASDIKQIFRYELDGEAKVTTTTTTRPTTTSPRPPATTTSRPAYDSFGTYSDGSDQRYPYIASGSRSLRRYPLYSGFHYIEPVTKRTTIPPPTTAPTTTTTTTTTTATTERSILFPDYPSLDLSESYPKYHAYGHPTSLEDEVYSPSVGLGHSGAHYRQPPYPLRVAYRYPEQRHGPLSRLVRRVVGFYHRLFYGPAPQGEPPGVSPLQPLIRRRMGREVV